MFSMIILVGYLGLIVGPLLVAEYIHVFGSSNQIHLQLVVGMSRKNIKCHIKC